MGLLVLLVEDILYDMEGKSSCVIIYFYHLRQCQCTQYIFPFKRKTDNTKQKQKVEKNNAMLSHWLYRKFSVIGTLFYDYDLYRLRMAHISKKYLDIVSAKSTARSIFCEMAPALDWALPRFPLAAFSFASSPTPYLVHCWDIVGIMFYGRDNRIIK